MPNIPLEIFQSILFFIPAAVTNPGAVITGGHFPVDFGKKFVDGRRIFGDGKTWSGFFGGVGTGIILGLIIFAITILTLSTMAHPSCSSCIPEYLPPCEAVGLSGVLWPSPQYHHSIT